MATTVPEPGIPFTQYLLPRGERQSVTIQRPPAVEAQARAVIAAGMRFEAEMLSDYRTVSLTVVGPDDAGDVAIVLVSNGPGVPAAVDQLVADAFRLLPRTARDASAR